MKGIEDWNNTETEANNCKFYQKAEEKKDKLQHWSWESLQGRYNNENVNLNGDFWITGYRRI